MFTMDLESSAGLIQSKPRFEPKIQTLEKERIKWIFPRFMDPAANLPAYFLPAVSVQRNHRKFTHRKLDVIRFDPQIIHNSNAINAKLPKFFWLNVSCSVYDGSLERRHWRLLLKPQLRQQYCYSRSIVVSSALTRHVNRIREVELISTYRIPHHYNYLLARVIQKRVPCAATVFVTIRALETKRHTY